MSWAAKRKTTRIEDGAYCLLGVFQINLSLRYNEGWRAFLRLKQELVQQSTDKSIFASRLSTNSGILCDELFAGSPARCERHGLAYDVSSNADGVATILTNRGLQIRAQSVRVLKQEFNQVVGALGGRFTVEAAADVFSSRTTSPQPPLVSALARNRKHRQNNQVVRVCTDDFGEGFEKLFSTFYSGTRAKANILHRPVRPPDLVQTLPSSQNLHVSCRG